MEARRGVVVAWLLVVLLSLGLTLGSASPAGEGGPEARKPPAIDLSVEYQVRYLVGMQRLFGPQAARGLLQSVEQAVDDRLRDVVLAVVRAELDGTASVQTALAESGSADALELLGWYSVGLKPGREFVERYGYVARLAMTQGLSPDDPLREQVLREGTRTAVATFVGIALIGVAMLAGVALLVLAVVLTRAGRLRWAFVPPAGDVAAPLYGFTVYLYLVMLLSAGLSLLPESSLPFAANLIPPCLATLAGLLIVLSRASQAGVAAGHLGVHAGRGLWREAGCGVLGYVAGLPLLAAGIALTVLLSSFAGATPSHPVVEVVGKAPVGVVLLAVVVAPLTEELMFRGALLAHCRAWSGPWVASLVTGLVFAAVHPQGWAAIPTLTAIGVTLALIRQWRGSLVAPVVAHAINNALVMTLLLVAMT